MAALRALAPEAIGPRLYSLLQQTSDLSAPLKTSPPWPPRVSPRHLPLQNPCPPSRTSFTLLPRTHPCLQPRRKLLRNLPPQRWPPRPTAGSLPSYPSPPEQEGQLTLRFPGSCPASPSTERRQGCEPPRFRLGNLSPRDGSVANGFAGQKAERFPRGLQKSLTTFAVIRRRRLFQLALGDPTNTAVLGFDFYFLIPHFTLREYRTSMPRNTEAGFWEEGLDPETPTTCTPSPSPGKFLWLSETAKAEKKQGAWTSSRNSVILNKNCTHKESESKSNLTLKVCSTGYTLRLLVPCPLSEGFQIKALSHWLCICVNVFLTNTTNGAFIMFLASLK